MSPSRPLKIITPAITQSESVLDEAVARLVLGMDGDVIYANPACDIMAGMVMKGENFLTAATFEEPDEAFTGAAQLFSKEQAVLSTLRPGAHPVRFNRTGEQAWLQFDIVAARDGARYVIASALEGDEAFTRTVEKLINRVEPADDRALQHFLALSSDLLCVCTDDAAFESVNAQLTQTLGFTLEEIAGRGFLDLVHPDDRAPVRTALQSLIHDETPQVYFECRLISNEARSVWMDWTLKKADGKIFAVGRDITAMKRHENALMRREQQLSEAEAIGRMGHWHWTIGQQSIRFSGEIYRIFGVDPAQFSATLDSVNALLHRRDAGRMMQAFQRAIIEQNDHEIDFRVVTPDGETRHVRCQGRCEFDSEGDVIGLYGIMQDVTEAMNHERALREAKEAAERAYAAKSQFLANMSHELRTPLNAIIGFSEMMQQQLLGPIGNEHYLDYLKGINESGEHLLDLINDILDMSKIEAGKYALDLEQVKLAKVIKLAIHMVESRAAEKGIKIMAALPEDDFTIIADRRAVIQITLNLLSNAVKFSHPNAQVEVDCKKGQDHISLRVRDHGIGIPANKLKTITNPFEQAANQYTRSHEGTGLGLSITKELAELHGGAIHLESVVEVGTTVTIRLPIDASKTRRDQAA
jgi:two-component system cell cycle sensor histidine kinase PleC